MSSLTERADRLAAQANDGQPFRAAWRPDQGDHPNPLTAVVIDYSEAQTEHGPRRILNVRDLDGNEWAIWLIHAALRSMIDERNPQEGQMIYLHYQGKKQSKKSPDREFHAYNIQIEMADQAAFSTRPIAEEDDIPF